MENNKVFKAEDYNYVGNNEQLDQSAITLEKKIDEMQKMFQDKFLNISKEVLKITDNMVKKDELLKKLDEIKQPNSVNNTQVQQDVEKEVVEESASFAKQLIDFLEEASLKYVNERKLKDELRKELLNTQKQLKEVEQQKSVLELKIQHLESKLPDEQPNAKSNSDEKDISSNLNDVEPHSKERPFQIGQTEQKSNLTDIE